MNLIERIKSGVGIKARSSLYSVMGGLVLMVFWIYINQMKTEAQVPFWDIVDFANETEAETAQEQTATTVAETETTQPDPIITIQPQPVDVFPSLPVIPTQPQVVVPAIPVIKPKVAVPKKILGPYKDGTYAANSYTPWGDITVSMLVKNGKWSNVRYLNIPDSPPSQYAASYLAKQALQAQNENIDGVSGATYTSDAFRDDLSQIVQQSKV